MKVKNNRDINQKQLLLLVLILTFSLSSCKEDRRREEVARIVNEWIGKEIKFPENMPCFVLGKDTLPEFCDESFHKEYKILLYVDSTGCNVCRLDLFEWQQVIEETDSLFPNKVGFLLFFQPQDIEEVSDWILYNRFDHPVFMDTNGLINRLNRFPQAMQYQCFLLDKDNKVLAIGNPALNIHIWELYKQIISDEKETEPRILTAIEVDKTVHDYGKIRKGSTNSADFTVYNTGTNPLVISRISVACGCTNVVWDKQPIAPGQSTTIRVEMTSEETGFFSKTVVVYCNADESPTRLTVTGETSE